MLRAPATDAKTREWATTIIDIEQWVDFTNSQLGQKYRYVGTDFSKFSYDPTELPIIYLTGWKPLPEIDDATIAKIRQYLMDGGTWIVHSSCGRPEFNDSFRREYLGYVARVAGRRFTVVPDTSFAAIREARLDRLADLVAEHLDQDRVGSLLAAGAPPLPSLRLTLTTEPDGTNDHP